MKRANWTYLVATALVLSTGVSVAGAKSKHHSKLSSSGFGISAEHKGRGHGWGRLDPTTTTQATTTTRPATTTTHATTTTAAPTTTTAAPTTTTTPPPLPAPTPAGGFLSYPRQGSPTTINGGTNVVVSNKTWQGFSTNTALVISGANNVYLHDLDFADNGGDIFLINCTGQIRIENIRARNTGDGTIGSGHGNVIQLNNTWDNGTGGIRAVYALGGDTEDMISIYRSGGIDASHPLIIEDVHIESPLPPSSIAWSSNSGTGINLGDDGGHDIILRNSTVLNAGAVGIQMNEPSRNVRAMNNIVYGTARATSNVGLSQWADTSCSTCTGNAYTNNRVWWVKANGTPSALWLSGTYPVAQSGNVLQDPTINPAVLHVAL